MQESTGRKPNGQTAKSVFSIKYSNINKNIIFSDISANIGNKYYLSSRKKLSFKANIQG